MLIFEKSKIRNAFRGMSHFENYPKFRGHNMKKGGNVKKSSQVRADIMRATKKDIFTTYIDAY